METTDTTLVYHHSIKVPTQYRVAARLLKKTFEEGGSLKGLIFQEKHAVIFYSCSCVLCAILHVYDLIGILTKRDFV